MNTYHWLHEITKKNQEWTKQQNQQTEEWFSQTELKERIQYLKAKEKNSLYREIVECHGMLYACKQTPDSALSIVRMDRQFHELETIISSDIDAYGFVPFTVIPNPIDAAIVALQVVRVDYTDPSLVLWDTKQKCAMKIIDDVFYFDWSLDGKTLYYSDAKTDVAQGKKTNFLRSVSLGDLTINTLYEDDHNAIWIQPFVAKSGMVLVHIFLDYRCVILKLFDPATTTIHTICDEHANNIYLGMIDDTYYLYSNYRKENGEIFTFQYQKQPSELTSLYASDSLIMGAALVKNTMYIISIWEGANLLDSMDRYGNNRRRIEMPDAYGAIDTLTGVKRDNGLYSDYFYMTYQSFGYPESIFRIDPNDNTITIVSSAAKRPALDMKVEKAYVDTRDGKTTIAYLVYDPKKMIPKETPTLMYGYGGYGDSTVPWFNALYMDLDIVDWVARGGMYVHCLLRGGGEFGEAWHQDGMLGNKKNTFYDFIDIAEWLIQNQYTTKEKLAINGGSNGGLLTAAVVAMRPDLFKAAIINLPLTDMMNYCYDERGPMYITEFGDPRGELKDYILSYSPFHNIHPNTAYPAVFIQSGALDRNVPCYHAKKFYARIKECTTSQLPCLLKILEKGAHDVGTGKEHYQLCAQEQLFLEHMLNMR